ncbi:MAG: PIN domain-containing protein [Elusimicrobia bacterium]|nr:PIN domain-containing protein [Elusimicrobiota bacterium]
MIAADTSAWIDYAKGTTSEASRHLEAALAHGTLIMPPPVLFEILSGPGLTGEAKEAILRLPRLSVADGYWERAGSLRGALMAKGLKARAMDCLIAQNCIDNDIPLIASDRDFRHFAACGLKVL